MHTRCPQCNGRKQVIGLGNMLKDCNKCSGVGFVKEEPKKAEPIVIPDSTLIMDKPVLDSTVSSIPESIELTRAPQRDKKKSGRKSYAELARQKKSYAGRI